MFNDYAKELVSNWKIKKNKNTITKNKLNKIELFLSGALAGMGQITITYPGEVIFTRLAINGSKLYNGPKYNGILDCIIKTIKIDKISSLYNGYLITLLSGTPYVALQMSIYEISQRTLLRDKKSDDLFYIPFKLISGATASIVAQTITFPGDVIRRRLQSDGMGGTQRIYKGIIDAMRKIYKNEGIYAFFDGAKVNIVRCIPEGAIMFFTFDMIKWLLSIDQFDAT